MNSKKIKIIQPDDWHVHLREGQLLEAVAKYSSRINRRCIVMPNLNEPITSLQEALNYKKIIKSIVHEKNFTPLIPCYLTEKLNLSDFKNALKNKVFIGAKLYPSNVTTNSNSGIINIENIFPSLEILEEMKKPLLIHGEKAKKEVNFFDREKLFVDDELLLIRDKFPHLKIILEHVSSKYGADFVNDNHNIAATITPQHLLLTKKDVFFKDSIDPHGFCMPVVKEEKDLVALRKYATSGSKKFFLGTDSAPHHIDFKIDNLSSKPGIFSSPCSLELYASIFEEESSLNKLENFCSINGPNFYDLPINDHSIELIKKEWQVPEFTIYKDIKIKNFFGGKKLNWKVEE